MLNICQLNMYLDLTEYNKNMFSLKNVPIHLFIKPLLNSRGCTGTGSMQISCPLVFYSLVKYISNLVIQNRGPQPPKPQTVRNRAAQQEVSGGFRTKLHLPLPIAPYHSHYHLNHTPRCGKIVSRETSPWCHKRLGTANSECLGSFS